MYKYATCITFVLLAALGLAGCETLPWERRADSANPPVELLDENELRGIDGIGAPPEQKSDKLTAAPRRRFADVPQPADLREDFERTYIYESSTIQLGRMVYYTKASVTRLAQFYIDECTAEGWNLKSVERAEGAAKLAFNKPGKELIVEAATQGVGRSQKLTVNLRPAE